MNRLQDRLQQALSLHQRGMLSDAEKICKEILQQQPKHFDALHFLGLIALQTNRAERSVSLIGKAIALKPDFADAYNNRGLALLALGRHAEALVSYDKAIALQPDYAEAHNNRGLALFALRCHAEALASYDRAIALKPDFAEGYYNRGTALDDLQHVQEALVSYDKAIALKPDYTEAHNNRGNALEDLQRYREALVSYDKLIALKPDFAEGQWNKSLCLLQLGQFKRGWELFEWRKKLHKPIANRSFPQPLWLGQQNIAGKTLFIYWEQGFGDTLQFCRYAKLVQARGARVIMSVQDPLLRLLRQMEPAIRLVGDKEKPGAFDYHCPLLSLPLAMGTTLETIPSEPRYLAADDRLCAEWATRLPPKRKPRIGLVWRGNPVQKNDRNRSMNLAALLPLLHDDAEWICLQQELNEEDAALLARDGRIAFVGGDLKDFSDTAALIELMDLVITVDTGVAHLAGAMGKPVWILLCYNTDWRWLTDRNDCPWYPSARLFRQREIGNWGDVVNQVRHELDGMIDRGA